MKNLIQNALLRTYRPKKPEPIKQKPENLIGQFGKKPLSIPNRMKKKTKTLLNYLCQIRWRPLNIKNKTKKE